MKPDTFRQLGIEPGTLIGVAGDYNSSPSWGDGWLKATLLRYLVVEHLYSSRTKEVLWDAAAVALLPDTLQTVDGNTRKEVVVNELLLLHRYPDGVWENDCTVLVYGVRVSESLGQERLSPKVWPPKTAWLSAAAALRVF